MAIEQEEELQTKGIDKLVNNIVAENFHTLEKGRDIQVEEDYRISKLQGHKKKKTQIYHNQNT
jgi:hypothetical protein